MWPSPGCCTRGRHSTTSLIPILGSRTRAQLDATSDALNLTLSADQVSRIEAASAVPLGAPHERARGSAASLAGGKTDLLEAPAVPVA
jgi:hypothetical protein